MSIRAFRAQHAALLPVLLRASAEFSSVEARRQKYRFAIELAAVPFNPIVFVSQPRLLSNGRVYNSIVRPIRTTGMGIRFPSPGLQAAFGFVGCVYPLFFFNPTPSVNAATFQFGRVDECRLRVLK